MHVFIHARFLPNSLCRRLATLHSKPRVVLTPARCGKSRGRLGSERTQDRRNLPGVLDFRYILATVKKVCRRSELSIHRYGVEVCVRRPFPSPPFLIFFWFFFVLCLLLFFSFPFSPFPPVDLNFFAELRPISNCTLPDSPTLLRRTCPSHKPACC